MSFFLLQNNRKYHFKPFVPIRAKDVQLGALNKTVNIFILGKNWVIAHCKWYTLLAMRLNLPYWSKKSDCCGLIYMGYKYNEFFAPNYKPCAELADLTVVKKHNGYMVTFCSNLASASHQKCWPKIEFEFKIRKVT